MMRYNVFKLTENVAGGDDFSKDDDDEVLIDIRGTKSKTCITKRLGRNVFEEVNGLKATVTRESRTLTTNLKLTVLLRDNLRRSDTEGSERTRAR